MLVLLYLLLPSFAVVLATGDFFFSMDLSCDLCKPHRGPPCGKFCLAKDRKHQSSLQNFRKVLGNIIHPSPRKSQIKGTNMK